MGKQLNEKTEGFSEASTFVGAVIRKTSKGKIRLYIPNHGDSFANLMWVKKGQAKNPSINTIENKKEEKPEENGIEETTNAKAEIIIQRLTVEHNDEQQRNALTRCFGGKGRLSKSGKIDVSYIEITPEELEQYDAVYLTLESDGNEYITPETRKELLGTADLQTADIPLLLFNQSSKPDDNTTACIDLKKLLLGDSQLLVMNVNDGNKGENYNPNYLQDGSNKVSSCLAQQSVPSLTLALGKECTCELSKSVSQDVAIQEKVNGLYKKQEQEYKDKFNSKVLEHTKEGTCHFYLKFPANWLQDIKGHKGQDNQTIYSILNDRQTGHVYFQSLDMLQQYVLKKMQQKNYKTEPLFASDMSTDQDSNNYYLECSTQNHKLFEELPLEEINAGHGGKYYNFSSEALISKNATPLQIASVVDNDARKINDFVGTVNENKLPKNSKQNSQEILKNIIEDHYRTFIFNEDSNAQAHCKQLIVDYNVNLFPKLLTYLSNDKNKKGEIANAIKTYFEQKIRESGNKDQAFAMLVFQRDLFAEKKVGNENVRQNWSTQETDEQKISIAAQHFENKIRGGYTIAKKILDVDLTKEKKKSGGGGFSSGGSNFSGYSKNKGDYRLNYSCLLTENIISAMSTEEATDFLKNIFPILQQIENKDTLLTQLLEKVPADDFYKVLQIPVIDYKAGSQSDHPAAKLFSLALHNKKLREEFIGTPENLLHSFENNITDILSSNYSRVFRQIINGAVLQNNSETSSICSKIMQKVAGLPENDRAKVITNYFNSYLINTTISKKETIDQSINKKKAIDKFEQNFPQLLDFEDINHLLHLFNSTATASLNKQKNYLVYNEQTDSESDIVYCDIDWNVQTSIREKIKNKISPINKESNFDWMQYTKNIIKFGGNLGNWIGGNSFLLENLPIDNLSKILFHSWHSSNKTHTSHILSAYIKENTKINWIEYLDKLPGVAVDYLFENRLLDDEALYYEKHSSIGKLHGHIEKTAGNDKEAALELIFAYRDKKSQYQPMLVNEQDHSVSYENKRSFGEKDLLKLEGQLITNYFKNITEKELVFLKKHPGYILKDDIALDYSKLTMDDMVDCLVNIDANKHGHVIQSLLSTHGHFYKNFFSKLEQHVLEKDQDAKLLNFYEKIASNSNEVVKRYALSFIAKVGIDISASQNIKNLDYFKKYLSTTITPEEIKSSKGSMSYYPKLLQQFVSYINIHKEENTFGDTQFHNLIANALVINSIANGKNSNNIITLLNSTTNIPYKTTIIEKAFDQLKGDDRALLLFASNIVTNGVLSFDDLQKLFEHSALPNGAANLFVKTNLNQIEPRLKGERASSISPKVYMFYYSSVANPVVLTKDLGNENVVKLAKNYLGKLTAQQENPSSRLFKNRKAKGIESGDSFGFLFNFISNPKIFSTLTTETCVKILALPNACFMPDKLQSELIAKLTNKDVIKLFIKIDNSEENHSLMDKLAEKISIPELKDAFAIKQEVFENNDKKIKGKDENENPVNDKNNDESERKADIQQKVYAAKLRNQDKFSIKALVISLFAGLVIFAPFIYKSIKNRFKEVDRITEKSSAKEDHVKDAMDADIDKSMKALTSKEALGINDDKQKKPKNPLSKILIKGELVGTPAQKKKRDIKRQFTSDVIHAKKKEGYSQFFSFWKAGGDKSNALSGLKGNNSDSITLADKDKTKLVKKLQVVREEQEEKETFKH